MDLFKLIFEHDMRLDALKERQLDRSVQQVSQSIEDFLKPDPTYSKFYISGTVLGDSDLDVDHLFGLNQLNRFEEVLDAIENGLNEYNYFYQNRKISLLEFAEQAEIGYPVILTFKNTCEWDIETLMIDSGSNVGHKKSELAEVLEEDDLVLYKEPALQGFDFHLFSRKNIYPSLFYPLQKLIDPDFRFFSINGKRIQSERKFYFETWSLNRPPHGVEEVFIDTKL